MIAGIVILALSLWGAQKLMPGKECDSIRITVGGEEYGTYSLSEDRDIDIGGSNTCRIKDGVAYMLDASCPDHYCMQQSPIDKDGGTIICLPNKVIIEGAGSSGNNDPEADAIV